MKLGDSMVAPIEACNVWNDVCPRKTRPPKIGDIPRHVAVDEESPGSSSTRSLADIKETRKIPRKSMLERSTSCCHGEHGKPVTVALPPPPPPPRLETFVIPDETAKNLEQVPSSVSGKLDFSKNDSLQVSCEHSNETIPLGRTFNNGSAPMLELLERPLENLKKNPCVQVFESTISEPDCCKLYEEADGIFQVRKDSALYLEAALGGLRERDLPLEERGATPSRLSGPRTRRESSGYFSNLGTFDEDRWGACPTMDHDTASATTTTTTRERRKSCTKNRLPMTNNQPHVSDVGGLAPSSQQAHNRLTLGCPTNDDQTTLSLCENDLPAAISKSGRLEMPNIDEQPTINNSSQLDVTSVYTTKSQDVADIDVQFTNKLSIEPPPPPREGTDDSTICEANELKNSSDHCKTTSPRTASRQKRRMVVHQYSSPTMTNPELERIVEKPYGERLDRSSKNVEKEVETSASDPRVAEDHYDDEQQVVVAEHGGAISEDCRQQRVVDKNETRKLLPKSVKVYQLLSTQSEDRGDGDSRLYDRRISLQIPRNNEEESMRANDNCPPLAAENYAPLCCPYVEEKKLIHADSVPIIKIPNLVTSSVEGELRLRAGERIADGSDVPTGAPMTGIRPIYPYCPYSPYASPQGSPRTNRRRPLRESRRVSIDSRQGALQLNQYKLLKNIGQGSYGIVKLAYNEEDDTHYAMKILSKKKLMKKAGIFGRIAPGRKGSSNPLAKVYREIALLKKLDHPNVVKLVEVLDDPDEDNLYLVFELVQKGEVLQLPTDKPLDEETARRHFRDVVMGVEYLHYQRIVHRDIKPSNLLVDSDGKVKVADLGVSAELRADGELLSGSAGTPAFAAPETTTPGAQYSGTLCDVWSMGVTLYSLVTGKVPWDGAGSIIGVQAAVRSEPLRFPDKPQLSEDIRHLITRMLTKDPTKRTSLGEIKEHRWLTKNDEEPLPNEADNCRLPVTVTDEEVARVVTRVPKLDTLILIKTMLKQHSFQNPFLPRRIVRAGVSEKTAAACLNEKASTDNIVDTDSSTNGQTLTNKTEQFHNAGRSNSAPDSYEWQTNGRQISSESTLPPVKESPASQETETEKR